MKRKLDLITRQIDSLHSQDGSTKFGHKTDDGTKSEHEKQNVYGFCDIFTSDELLHLEKSNSKNKKDSKGLKKRLKGSNYSAMTVELSADSRKSPETN